MADSFIAVQEFNCYACHRAQRAYKCAVRVMPGRKTVRITVDKPMECKCQPFPPGLPGALKALVRRYRSWVMEAKDGEADIKI